MTTRELEQIFLQQPVSLLHRLARGRISRHFRSGKRKLVDLLLQASEANRAGLESDLAALIEEQTHRRPAGAGRDNASGIGEIETRGIPHGTASSQD